MWAGYSRHVVTATHWNSDLQFPDLLYIHSIRKHTYSTYVRTYVGTHINAHTYVRTYTYICMRRYAALSLLYYTYIRRYIGTYVRMCSVLYAYIRMYIRKCVNEI